MSKPKTKQKALISPQAGSQARAMNSKADLIFYGGAAGCVDMDTEFLTPQGWKAISEYVEGDEVAEYNLNTDTLESREPVSYVKVEESTLQRLSGRGLDMCLSNEHSVLYWGDYKAKPKTIPFEEVMRRHNKSKTKGWTGKIKTTFKTSSQGIEMSEGELRLQVAVMADGRIVKEGANNYTQMRFAKERKYLRLLELCSKFDLEFMDNGCKKSLRYKSGFEYEVIVFPKTRNKKYTAEYWECSQQQLEIITDEVCYWDGSFVKNNTGNTLRFFSKFKECCDFIQYAFASCGMNTSLVHDTREDKESWTTNGNSIGRGLRSFANKDRKNPLEEYKTKDGYKYCFETSTGYFLARRNGKIFITGNSGKTHLELMHPLKYHTDPNYNALFFRKNTKQIKQQGGLWPESKKLYNSFNIESNNTNLIHTFPSGANIQFAHLNYEDTKYSYQGGQVSALYFDEVNHISETQFTYLLSRLRSEAVNDGYAMATMNPDPDSWVLRWIEWWLDPEGLPDKAKQGIVRYYYVIDDAPVFGDTAKQLMERYPEVARIWNPNEEIYIEVPPKSLEFIAGTIFDNGLLLKNNPSYLSELNALPEVEKARLLHGNWYARAVGSGFFSREWVPKADRVPLTAKICRAWDKASTEPSQVNRSPDFTASIQMYKDKNNMYYIAGNFCPSNFDKEDPSILGKFRRRAGDRDNLILQQSLFDGDECLVVFPQDAGAAGVVEFQESAKKLIAEGIIVKKDPMPPQKSKLVRFTPFAAACENGLVSIVESTFPNKKTLDAFYKELESFDGERSSATKKDDWVDVCASAFNHLAKQKVLPAFKLGIDMGNRNAGISDITTQID